MKLIIAIATLLGAYFLIDAAQPPLWMTMVSSYILGTVAMWMIG